MGNFISNSELYKDTLGEHEETDHSESDKILQDQIIHLESEDERTQRCLQEILFKMKQDIIKFVNRSQNNTLNSPSDNLSKIRKLLDAYHELKYVNNVLRFREEIGSFLSESGAAKLLIQIIIESLDEKVQDSVITSSSNYQGLQYSLSVIHNYSETSYALAREICTFPDFMKILVNKLEIYYIKFVTEEHRLDKATERFLKSILGTIHNCAHFEENRELLTYLNLSDVLIKYMKNFKIEKIQIRALLGLADILSDEQSKEVFADMQGIKFLLQTFKDAVESQDLRSVGINAKELAYGVRRLALNDTNKILLVNDGVLSTLNKMIRLKSYDELNVAVEALLCLSFSEESKDKFLEEDGLIMMLYMICVTWSEKLIRQNARRTLWNLREVLLKSKSVLFENIGNYVNQMSKSKQSQAGSHIMISYSWKNKEIMLKIKNDLRGKGYETWMDEDNMYGSTLECMAQAVEQCEVFLYCLCQNYKDSSACQLEFEYAYQYKKTMIPLKLQSEYNPDGWLGIVTGSKKYINFVEDLDFTKKMDELVKDLGDRAKAKEKPRFPSSDAVMDSETIPEATPVQKQNKLLIMESLKQNDVKVWLYQKELLNSSTNCESVLSKLDGKQLSFLMRVKKECPDFYYSLIKSDLGLHTIPELMTFTNALEQLFLAT